MERKCSINQNQLNPAQWTTGLSRDPLELYLQFTKQLVKQAVDAVAPE
jgi:hypothetical protein